MPTLDTGSLEVDLGPAHPKGISDPSTGSGASKAMSKRLGSRWPLTRAEAWPRRSKVWTCELEISSQTLPQPWREPGGATEGQHVGARGWGWVPGRPQGCGSGEKPERRSAPSTPPLCQIQPLLRRTVPILMSSRLPLPLNHTEPGFQAWGVKIQMLTCRFAE